MSVHVWGNALSVYPLVYMYGEMLLVCTHECTCMG